ncbi:kinase-like protein [Melanomma pulvis-pyrius CBS 109.77]|uniref:Kinase-like protein n=1 Tax=Melanomma pulvis-pyrius CBS 109.77 TaxID=1314802 RepID=A0A6A6XNP9_9PLEO|nr:kinase-like protein [Melanomma pulvis-pyrius CBS 109.77]
MALYSNGRWKKTENLQAKELEMCTAKIEADHPSTLTSMTNLASRWEEAEQLQAKELETSFCGTPEYFTLEQLLNGGYDKTVHWWTLGVLLYKMLTGLPPYYDENANEMYRKILHEPLHFHDNRPGLVLPVARDLIARLLDRNPKRRLGVNGTAEIKAHDFFHSIDWRKLLDRKYEPSFKPNVTDARDTANFDGKFSSEPPTDTHITN